MSSEEKKLTSLPGEIGVEDVERQLARILDSDQLRRSPMLRKILRFVVEQALRGDDVPDATAIAVGALGKSPSFRSSQDASVRVAMNRLRTVLELYYSKEGASDDIVIRLQAGSCRPTFALRGPNTVPDLVKDALSLAEAYQEIITREANSFVLRALKSALKSQPENPLLLAGYTDMCLDAHKFQFQTLERPLDQAIWALEQATAIEPDNPAVVFQQAMMAMEHQDLATVTELGKQLIRQESDDTAAVCRGVFLLAQIAPSTPVQEAFRPEPMDAAARPGWLHHAPFLHAYHRQEYESALGAAMNFGMPHFFWGPLERAAALAQLGILPIAKQQLSCAFSLKPDFAVNPRWHLSHHIKHEDTLEHVLDGLGKAGLVY